MKFYCDNCNAKYLIGDDKVRGKILRIRCKRCSHVIVVREPTRPAESASAASPLTSSTASVGAASAPAMPAAASASPPQKAVDWYYAMAGRTYGPYSLDALRDLFATGQLGDEAYVWNESFTSWSPAIERPEFARYFASGMVRKPARPTMALQAVDVEAAVEQARAMKEARQGLGPGPSTALGPPGRGNGEPTTALGPPGGLESKPVVGSREQPPQTAGPSTALLGSNSGAAPQEAAAPQSTAKPQDSPTSSPMDRFKRPTGLKGTSGSRLSSISATADVSTSERLRMLRERLSARDSGKAPQLSLKERLRQLRQQSQGVAAVPSPDRPTPSEAEQLPAEPAVDAASDSFEDEATRVQFALPETLDRQPDPVAPTQPSSDASPTAEAIPSGTEAPSQQVFDDGQSSIGEDEPTVAGADTAALMADALAHIRSSEPAQAEDSPAQAEEPDELAVDDHPPALEAAALPAAASDLDGAEAAEVTPEVSAEVAEEAPEASAPEALQALATTEEPVEDEASVVDAAPVEDATPPEGEPLSAEEPLSEDTAAAAPLPEDEPEEREAPLPAPLPSPEAMAPPQEEPIPAPMPSGAAPKKSGNGGLIAGVVVVLLIVVVLAAYFMSIGGSTNTSGAPSDPNAPAVAGAEPKGTPDEAAVKNNGPSEGNTAGAPTNEADNGASAPEPGTDNTAAAMDLGEVDLAPVDEADDAAAKAPASANGNQPGKDGPEATTDNKPKDAAAQKGTEGTRGKAPGNDTARMKVSDLTGGGGADAFDKGLSAATAAKAENADKGKESSTAGIKRRNPKDDAGEVARLKDDEKPTVSGTDDSTFANVMRSARQVERVEKVERAERTKEAPAALPSSLSRDDLQKGFKNVRRSAGQCLERHLKRAGVPLSSGKVKVIVTIQNSGTVSKVTIDQAVANTVFGTCLRSHMSRWKFPKFTGAPIQVSRKFVLQ